MTDLLSQATQEHIGVKWKQIRTTVGYQKPDPANLVQPIKAFHLEGPSDKAHDIRTKLARWYSSSSNEFLEGTKMRLIPPISSIFSRDGKVKIASLIARQDALNTRLAHASTTEFASNLLLDKPSPHCFKSLHQIMMEVKSEKYPSCSVFHSIDRLFASDRAVCVTYVPENAYEGNKFVAGLIPYLRSIDPWFLSQFTEDARNRQRNNHWNPTTQEVASTEELEMANNVYGDNELNCSDKPTAIREPKPTIEIVLPDVEMSDSTPHVLQDSDSVSTFRSKVSTKSILKQPSSRFTPTSHTDPTSLTSFDDRSVSKISDSTSKLLAFEDKFNQVTQELHQRSVTQEAEQKENRAMLTAFLNTLQLNQGFYDNTSNAGLLNQATAGGQSSAPADQANSLTQSTMTGGPSGAAGSGS